MQLIIARENTSQAMEHSTGSVSSATASNTSRRKRRKLGESVPVMSPAMYLSLALKNKGIASRIGPLCVEQALYFEPYREAQISYDILRAIRKDDVKVLREFRTEQLSERNQFGESLLHLACRFGFANSVEYLVKEAKLPLNIRDKFGRSPLHNVCLSPKPNFENVILLLNRAPKLVLFEDDKGKIPFDYISAKNHGRWSRFLSEERILKFLQSKLGEEEEEGNSSPINSVPTTRIPVQGISLP